jgi:2-dehydro-3-deoxyphosphogluconate aldolase/(4S)-4-hydroxy-2-oxoglutarate aldolase
MTIADRLRQLRIVPVIVIDDATAASALADALVDGGLPCVEITFRTAAAEDAIRRLTGERADLLVGAGTVLTPQQAASARAAGAQFIVSPGFNRSVVDYCLAHEMPVFPGVCTPTEVEMGLGAGLTVVKFFPAEPMGGVAFLKAISAPYSGVEFVPTGGINVTNLSAYLQLKNVLACGGSWMAPAEWIKARDFARIRAETRKAVELLGAAPALQAR